MQDVLRSLMPLHLILYSKIFKDYIMKRIIMFKGGVETLEFFSVEIAEYLESKGYEIFWYNLLLSKNSFNELMHYYNNHCNEQLYAITFNFEEYRCRQGRIEKICMKECIVLSLWCKYLHQKRLWQSIL